jgi:hypothetical protein
VEKNALNSKQTHISFDQFDWKMPAIHLFPHQSWRGTEPATLGKLDMQ